MGDLDCTTCPFPYDEERAGDAAAGIVAEAEAIAARVEALADPAARVDERWSPLEYACHVRDVCTVLRELILQARVVAAPTPWPLWRDDRARLDEYALQEPATVAGQLRSAAALLAHTVDGALDGGHGDRTVTYRFPETATRSLRWVAIHAWHEVTHHRHDVEAVSGIVADDADWTWVLERTCPECGFDVADLDPAAVAGLIRENASAWQTVLARPDVRVRTAPDRWSPLEYACHVRDVFRIYLHRLQRMLTEDGPHYDNWDQDQTAVADDYNAQQPATVAAELTTAAAALADAFDDVAGDAWSRTGFRSDGAAFTVDTFARYFIHDPVHHLWDVRRDA